MRSDDDALRRAISLLRINRPRNAETLLRQAILHSPADAKLHHQLARALLAQQRYREALETAHRSLALDPESSSALLTVSAIEEGLGNLPASVRAARRAVALAPGSADAHLQLGAALVNDDRASDALPHARKARGMDPSSVPAATILALVHLLLRQYDEARTQAVEALRLGPDDAEAHRVAALVEGATGKPSTALLSGREAMRIDPLHQLSRTAYTEAMKSRNPIYRWVIRWKLRRPSLDWRIRMLTHYAPLIVLAGLTLVIPDVIPATAITLVVFLFLVWSVEPVMNFVICIGGNADLLPRAIRTSTWLYAGHVVIATACLVCGTATGQSRPLWAALVAAAWSLTASRAHFAIAEVQAWVLGAQFVGAALVICVCVLALVDSDAFAQAASLITLAAGVCWLVEVLDWRSIADGGTS